MPENGSSVPEIVDAYEDWLNDRGSEPDGVTVGDLDAVVIVTYCRLRSIFTQEQMHQKLHMLFSAAERMLHTPGVFIDHVTGAPADPLLAEQYQDMGPEYLEMLQQYQDGVGDDELHALLAEGDDERISREEAQAWAERIGRLESPYTGEEE